MSRKLMTRREMMTYSISTVAGLTLITSCSQSLKQSCRRGFKLGVCDWTIGLRANPDSFETAKRLGLDGVQVDFGMGEDSLPLFNPRLQEKFLEESKKYKVEIPSLALGAFNQIPYKSDPRAEKWLYQCIDVCEAMGVKGVLLAFFGKGDMRNDSKGIDTVVERLKKVTPKAEKAGIYLSIESMLSAEQHLDIIERVDSPAVKVYYDVANSHKAGYDIYREIRLLGKHICEFHAKDNKNVFGKGNIDFKEVRRAMDDIDYRGWIVIESAKTPFGKEETVRRDGVYLRQIFGPNA